MYPLQPRRLSVTRTAITKEELAQLEVGRYAGPISLIASAHDLERAMHDIRRERVVGFDTETKPTFRRGESHLPSLVQIATAHEVYLFQLRRMDFSDALRAVLENRAITKAGVSLADDLASLRKLFPFQEQSVVDFGLLAQRLGYQQSGVRNLAGLLLGIRIPKGARTSNWARVHLSQSQILYAATDAWICRELFLHLQKTGPHKTKP
jgi:ribonuclease D